MSDYGPFTAALAAIDAGDPGALQQRLDESPGLVALRLDQPTEGYFAHPYLLYFVAGNPIRSERLPSNIATLTDVIIETISLVAPGTLQGQLDYTLGLVCSGSVPRQSGMQIGLIDTLVDAGATPDSGIASALPHRELEALQHLLAKGASLSLPAAIALNRSEEAVRLMRNGDRSVLQTGLAVAAFYGRAELLRLLLSQDLDLDAWNPAGYHAHSTALHQAAFGGWLDCVRLLVEAGADVKIEDRLFHSTALGWADHAGQAEVVAYLSAKK